MFIVLQPLKKCSRCKQEKAISEFHKNKRNKDGLRSCCKDCRREYTRKWRADNPELARVKYHKSSAKWRATHQEYNRNRKRKWRIENIEHEREYQRQRRSKNPEHYRELNRRWRSKNPDQAKAIYHRRRAYIAGNGGSFTKEEWLTLCAKYSYRCLAPGEHNGPLTPDHIVPLSMGGNNDISNIQPLCMKHNQKKGTKIIDYR